MNVYGNHINVGTRAVLIMFAEKGHAPGFHSIDILTGEHQTPAYLAVHPEGKVPVLDTGTSKISDVNDILEYLDRELSGPRLEKTAGGPGATEEHFMALAGSRLAPEAAKLIREIVERRLKGQEPNEDVIDSALKRLVPLLDEAEEALTHNQFFGGSSFALADVYWMACISVLMDTQNENLVRSRPQLSAWWDRTSARPSWQTTKQR